MIVHAALCVLLCLCPSTQVDAADNFPVRLSSSPSNMPVMAAMDAQVVLPGENDVYFHAPLNGWIQCADIEFDLAWPSDGPTNAQVLVHLMDWDWHWYQSILPGYLTPGKTRRYRVNMLPDADNWEPTDHHVPWQLRTLCVPINVAVRVYGPGPYKGTCRIERVEGRIRPTHQDPPSIRNVRASSSEVRCYEKFELTFTLPDRYANPFDPDQISVSATFEGPTGGVTTVNGFYAQDYYRTLGPTGERIEQQGHPQWKVRFAPRSTGRHRYRLTAKDSAGTAEWGPGELNATPARLPGYVRVSRRDPRYFEFDNGSCFFPIGHNIRSPFDTRTDQQFPWKQRWPEGSAAYLRYFRDMNRNGENMVEIWSAAWSLGLEWSPVSPGYHGVGQYNLRNAWEMDQVFDAADKFEMYMNLVIHNHGKFSTYSDPEWEANPFNTANGGYLNLPEEYLTDPRAARDFQNLMRYMIARWGYSTRLFAWELWSELNLTGSEQVNHAAHNRPQAVEWHRTMGRWLRIADPYRHMVTTHYSGDYRTQNPAITALPEIDHASVDAYHSKPEALHIVTLLHETAVYNNAFTKPVMVTEFGGQSMAQQGFDHIDCAHHAALWASTCIPCAGTPLFWWWMLVEEQSLYTRYGAIARFMKGEDRRDPEKKTGATSIGEKPAEPARVQVTGGAGNPRIAAIYYGGDSDLLGWIYDPERFDLISEAALPPLKGLAISVIGMLDGAYRVEFWDTREGKVFETADVEANKGKFTTALPPLARDMAFKVKPVAPSQRGNGK